MMALLAILLVICMALSSQGQALKQYITHSFELDENYPPIKLLLDDASETVYISAVNRLYQLNKMLDRSTLIEVVTGPKNDSTRCLPYERCDSQEMDTLGPTNNYNKLFLMDSKRRRLIVCGSIYQGICETRSMLDIQEIISGYPCKENKDCAFKAYSTVACLTENCTCVGVIAEGPTVNNPVIYVATTEIGSIFTNNRNTLSTRSLHINKTHENKIFGLAIDTISIKSELLVPSVNQERFAAVFTYTFATEGLDGFVYFLYRKEGKSEIILGRLCKQDPLLRSFITMNLTCNNSGENGEIVSAYYQRLTGSRDWNINDRDEGSLYVTYKNGGGSSICLFTLREINKAFDDGILACYTSKGKNSRNQEVVIADPELNGNRYSECPGDSVWMGADASLDDNTADTSSINLEYYKGYTIADSTYRCGASYLPKGLKILVPLNPGWSYHQSNKVFSGLTVDLVDGINVAYISTTDGEIIELDVNHKNVFNTLKLGSSVVGNLVLDNHPSLSVPHLYVMTRKEISHLKVSVCSIHTTCTDCLQAKDPYCGWCILSSSCIPKSTKCLSNSFLAPLSEQCVEATVQEPLERSLQQNVTVKVELLPALSPGDNYKCLFDGQYYSPAKVDNKNPNIIVCKTPNSESLPSNFPGEDYVDVSLSIVYNDETEIVSSIAKFYQCEAHGKTIDILQPCHSCLNNRWKGKCSWCVQSGMCVPLGKESSCLSSGAMCPTITTGNRSLILPVGIETEIVLQVENLPTEAGDEMSCNVIIEDNQPVKVKASLVGDSRSVIKCERKQFMYGQNQSEVPATVSVRWKPNFAVDVRSFNPVAFYKCTVSRGDCSLCVTANPEYKCGWCGSKCVIKELCASNWVTDDTFCPGPMVTSFFPTSGPLTGNTTVTIHGKDMGVRAEDVDRITIAGVVCNQQRELYQISNRITCILESDASTSPRKGKVSVTVRGITATSNEEFSFKSPTLQSVATPEGPVSGGTSVTIVGTDLDVGGKKVVFIDKYQCSNPEVLSSTELTCVSSAAAEQSMNLTISVLFDGYPVRLQNAFSYIEDPEVTGYATATGELACFLAGGRDIVFTGKRLNIIQKANLIAILNKDVVDKISAAGRTRRHISFRERLNSRLRRSTSRQDFSSTCKIHNSTRMICPTPEIHLTFGNDIENNVSNSIKAQGALRLRMDNINENVIDPSSGGQAILTYYPNPNVLDLVPENVKELRSESLLNIDVLNLNPDAVDASEITIMIGKQRCPVESIKDKVIRCNIPEKESGDQTTFTVTVKIGSRVWNIGEASYVSQQTPISIGLIAGLIVVVVVILVLLTVFCLRKQKHYKTNKNDFQKAIENLEMTVQADFRKAFAELSIDMTDLAADVGDVGIPVLSYRQYATNMFFPCYHPCMKQPNPNEKPVNGVHQGFVQFDLLIANKQFLMAFIRTLEQQRGFSNRDKANVASLITVVLHKKLDYFAEVMKSLVSELVAASVERNPKVLLRRTESVAERMLSNWLAICLFQHIRDSAGKPLFLLQKAIKHQVSKGPLDAVTGKTKYTLSDDSLLKEDIPCESLTLFVSQKETDPDDPIVVKVLSCDSIPQVKEKIMDAVYKKIPFSQRPKAEQLDLEWRHGRSGHLILPGNDQANEPGSRWRRVMTIKDYKVESNATMALIQREQGIDDADTSQFTNHSPDTSAVSPMLPEDNVKVYHLVKYADELEQKRESSILRDKHKHILDLYLLRLISMKGILQSYVDDVFNSILDTNSIPPAVKHFFDFLDELAKNHDISNQEITHIWKTNSVLGRFWVTLLKNPELVFDVDKPESVASSMAVISQTFIDACSVQEHQPTKDSPINKQLYAKEIPTYKKLVQKYYADVRQMQPVSDQDMCAHMTEISRSHDLEFDVHVAHNELWGYVNKYYEEIQETLSSDPNMTQMVIQRLQQAYTLIYSSVNNP